MSRLALAAGASFIAVALALPLATGGAASPGSQGPRVEAARFELKASGGFTADVDAAGHRVVLTLTRQLKRRREVAQYTVEGQVSTRRIDAEFGTLGSIAVEFHPTGVAQGMAPPSGCDGYFVQGRTGTFTGTVRFRGEGGYMELDAARARGEAGASTRWNCENRQRLLGGASVGRPPATAEEEQEAQAREYANLTATSGDGRFFRAVGGPAADRGDGLPFFAGASFERQASMKVVRQTVLEGGPGDFRFDDRLRAATVSPPEPFHGSAVFRRGEAGSTRWTGSLSVSLPGAENVALVDSSFRARLSHNLPGD
jgi:hypothetical protein